MSDGLFYVCVMILIFLFYGEPDIHDQLIQWLQCK